MASRFAVIKPSLDVERQFADERIPDWLGRPDE